MVNNNEAGIFLRVVTRVYLARSLDVSLTNDELLAGGADAGQSQGINLIDLSLNDPQRVDPVSDAYKKTLNTLSSAFNNPEAPGEDETAEISGASVRFIQANRRTISMKQTFDRPMVIGFTGFDVKILSDGGLSVPIPSFMVLSGDIEVDHFKQRKPITFTDDEGLSDAYIRWLREAPDENRQQVINFLKARGFATTDPADLAYNSALRTLLEAVRKVHPF